MRRINLFFISWLGLLMVANVWATDTHYSSQALQLTARQPQATQLECDYRLIQARTINNIEAKLGDIVLPILNNTPYPETSAQSAILFLIDISNPRRRAVILKNVEQIKTLINKSKTYHQLGLASFATELQVLAPLGTAAAEVAAATENLRAIGQTTELYRHALAATRLLAEFPAQRKTLFLLSYGEAEDQAYHHADVVQAANEAQIIIYSLGYAMSVTQSIHLQTLRRLSEETGGSFIQAGINFELPDEFLQSPYRAFDSGARLKFDLTPAIAASFSGNQQVQLTWQTETEPFSLKIAVTLPALSEAELIPVTSPPPEKRQLKQRLFYIIPAIILLLLLLLFWLKRQQSTSPQTIYAYLEFVEENDIYPITTSTVRIGRNSDNELHLTNTSVSNHHAEIHRRRDGSFVLTDLDSLNGIYVNSKKEKTVALQEGDLIELGEQRLKFIKGF